MAKRIVYLLVAVVLIAGVSVVVYRTDGNMEVTMRATPEKGPPVPARATNACPPFSLAQTSAAQPWPAPGPDKLVDGLYKHTFAIPIPPRATGTQSQELKLEMKRAQRR